jgi:hypothetical protein
MINPATHCSYAMDNSKTYRLFLSQTAFASDTAIIVYPALLKLTIHLFVTMTGGNGYFRGELYYIACSDHVEEEKMATGDVVIRLGGSFETVRESYREVTESGMFRNRYCMPYANNMPIYVCRSKHSSLTEDWPEFKHFE